MTFGGGGGGVGGLALYSEETNAVLLNGLLRLDAAADAVLSDNVDPIQMLRGSAQPNKEGHRQHELAAEITTGLPGENGRRAAAVGGGSGGTVSAAKVPFGWSSAATVDGHQGLPAARRRHTTAHTAAVRGDLAALWEEQRSSAQGSGVAVRLSGADLVLVPRGTSASPEQYI